MKGPIFLKDNEYVFNLLAQKHSDFRGTAELLLMGVSDIRRNFSVWVWCGLNQGFLLGMDDRRRQAEAERYADANNMIGAHVISYLLVWDVVVRIIADRRS